MATSLSRDPVEFAARKRERHSSLPLARGLQCRPANRWFPTRREAIAVHDENFIGSRDPFSGGQMNIAKFVLVAVLSWCASSNAVEVPASDQLDVWSLQKLAADGKTDVLNELFNHHSISLTQLPVGFAAGTGTRILGLEDLYKSYAANRAPLLLNSPVSEIVKKIANLLEVLTGANWRGKMFFPSVSPDKSMGLNRIKHFVTIPYAKIERMGSFVTRLVPNTDDLAQEVRGEVTSGANLVILNYAHPIQPASLYWQEYVLNYIQVYDVMAAVPGKYGPVFIGKTWIGDYDKTTSEFKPYAKQLVAWFFLDFNPAAMAAQKQDHWDKSEEDMDTPLPSMSQEDLAKVKP